MRNLISNKFRDLAHEHRHPLSFILTILTVTAILLLACSRGNGAEPSDVPRSLLAAMLHEETSSAFHDDGSVRYVNQRRGKAGEVGAWQAKPATLRLYKWSPSLYEQDTAYGERATRSILAHYYDLTGSWSAAAAAWRGGLNGRTQDYAIDYGRRVAGSNNN